MGFTESADTITTATTWWSVCFSCACLGYACRFTHFVLWCCSNIDYFLPFSMGDEARSRFIQIFVIIINIILRQWCGVVVGSSCFFFTSLYIVWSAIEGVLVCIDTFKLRLYNFRCVHPQFWPVFFFFFFFVFCSLLCYLQLVYKVVYDQQATTRIQTIYTLELNINLRPIHAFNNKENNVINKLVAGWWCYTSVYNTHALSRWDITFISRN